ncbi:MAG: bifunctional 4-hydroxy-3-methylbut-2-enyl diphosphate reductase/30S ribosomal protein S1 [Oscillospiraceae bacterium]|nr:bifunctional 4-hydroxy-3-methylbut-2-enyl diphosphate reductase/30S ribosomal protein S1 [Oscillospiraceae bacterium]
MNVIVAKTAGFCFGVQRAIAMCEKAAEAGANCVTIGPIIHNSHVTVDLEKKGIRIASGIAGVSPGDTVIIRAHGAAKAEFGALSKMGVDLVDATCPDVRKIHDIVREQSQAGRLIIIIGQRRHPEVTAISSWCGRCEIFETADELVTWLKSGDFANEPISMVSQTTNSENLFKICVEIVKKECTNTKIFDTICDATCKRQREAIELSKIADVMIVVGGRNSANSLRLADICRENCHRVIFAEDAGELEGMSIRQSDTVVITAGASTPAWIIKEVTHKMNEEVMDTRSELEQGSIPEPGSAEAAEATTADRKTDGDSKVVDTAAQVPAPAAEENAQQSGETTSVGQNVTNELEALSESVPSENEESDGESGGMESFEEMLEKSIKTLHTGEKVTGVVTSITATEVSVDLGTKQSGYIPIAEFTDDVNTDIDDIIKVGDTIESFVMRVNDVEGMVMLSKKRLDAIKNWDIIEQAKESKTVVEGLVVEENKGGVVVNVKGVRVFVPASQTGLPKSAPMSDIVKQNVRLRITEVNQSRRRVVGSIRAVQVDERREKSESVWNEIETGKQYDGVVKSMTSYGVFVDIGGVDGMIHISELSWTRIKQPSEVMSVGDEVSVYVLSFDKENRKISLGYKKHEDNPWTKFTMQYAAGDVVNVKIVKMMPFGAFAEICPGVDGLIHISQVTDHRIGLPSEVLSEGQLVDAKITEVDNDRKKVSLSIRALLEASSQLHTDSAVKHAEQDEGPMVVYDTDAPPPFDDESADDDDGSVA